ncbi:hypothetical protein GCM10009810_32010 [Nostocoides vanveenii]|uniref:Uncharacterized protein n=1 Tax=Nostocoides vanveenii TaxID=330835 RepID=A0ABP4XAI7_9MICO
MRLFKVVMQYPDGTSEDEDELFETEAEAEAYGLEQCNNYVVGGEVLHLSNPGDYPLNDDEVDFEVVEVDQ